MDTEQELRSLKRGLQVLSLLNQIEAVGISELARRLDLPRTTAERILLTLASEGYVERPPNDKRFRLSAKVCSLASGFFVDDWVAHIATPLLFDVTRQIGWPLAIATPVSDRMVLRLTTDSATCLWLNRRRVGVETPMLASSSGLMYLASAGAAERNQLLQVLRASPMAINRERAADAMFLSAYVDPATTQGYAIQPPPNNMPERSISVPIELDGRVVAILLLIYMPRAIKDSRVLRDYLPVLRDLAARIGAQATEARQHEPEPSAAEFEVPASVTAFRVKSVAA
jgi:IclR family mhp operon transcriptional activator